MNKETREVQIVKPQKENLYSEREIQDAWNEVGRSNNAISIAWIFEKLRANKNDQTLGKSN